MLLSQEWVRFLCVGPEHHPVLAVAADEPPDAAAPVTTAGSLDRTLLPGWTVLPRLTFVVVAAPDDEGFSVFCSDPDRVDEVARWVDAVEASAGTWLAFVPLDRFGAIPSPADRTVVLDGHGGFVPLATPEYTAEA